MAKHSYQHIYLSPHLDDAVMSCGATIHAQVRAGERVLVVTFFAGSPPADDLTAFTLELKERWGGAADPVAVRRSEDLAAMRVLGAHALHLPFYDCVYRQATETSEALYPTVEHIFGDVHPLEADLPRELLVALSAAVPQLEGATIYAPLTAGHHVDHILVQRVAFHLPERGCRVLFYEDYPYAGDQERVSAALAFWEPDCRQLVQVPVSPEALEKKRDAVACYVSQISTFWADADEMRAALRRHVLAAGGGICAENYWQVPLECWPDRDAG